MNGLGTEVTGKPQGGRWEGTRNCSGAWSQCLQEVAGLFPEQQGSEPPAFQVCDLLRGVGQGEGEGTKAEALVMVMMAWPRKWKKEGPLGGQTESPVGSGEPRAEWRGRVWETEGRGGPRGEDIRAEGQSEGAERPQKGRPLDLHCPGQ